MNESDEYDHFNTFWRYRTRICTYKATANEVQPLYAVGVGPAVFPLSR